MKKLLKEGFRDSALVPKNLDRRKVERLSAIAESRLKKL